MVKTNLPNNKHRQYGGAYSVHDPETVQQRDRLIQQFTSTDSTTDRGAEKIKRDFLHAYPDWMASGFRFPGLAKYQHVCFTQGTTESFAQFYIRYRCGHRLRLARSEYFYHQMMKSLWYQDNFAWLDQDEIRSGDVVLISVPFSDTGSAPTALDAVLDACDRLAVPVMLDLAYVNLTVGTVFDHTIDFEHPCIQYVVTSLSKVFPVENLRIGLRMQRVFFEDQLSVINEKDYNYINLLSAYVGHGMISAFDSGFMFHRYRKQQIAMCDDLGLEASPCFIFGLDHHNHFPEYNRGGNTNRLCFSRSWDGRYQKNLSNHENT